MNFEPLALEGAFLLSLETTTDERGSFTATFDAEAFRDRGLEATVARAAVSTNERAHTLRGMHLQREPHAEAKVIRCTRGAIFDVLIDLRPSSPSYRDWIGVELRADDLSAVYAPAGVAHGFLTIVDHAEVSYLLSAGYQVDQATGVRWDDPAFGVEWPAAPAVISDRDAGWPDYRG